MNQTTASARQWRDRAVGVLDADARGAAPTPLVRFPLDPAWGVHLYVKNEAAHPTGSLKHRLARALLTQAIVDGHITATTTVIEASSGSTAVSEAYFARLLGLPFVAVVPASTSRRKIELIEASGGRCELVAHASELSEASRLLAERVGGHFVDQFRFASAVGDWTGETGLAAEVITDLAAAGQPVPEWFVVGVGTGGTSAGIGRYCRSRRYATEIAIVDPEGSAYFNAWSGSSEEDPCAGSRIEGIGRPTAEPAFIPELVDRAMRVPDAFSIAGMRILEAATGLRGGGSTGTNIVGALHVAAGMRASGRRGSIVTLMCDSADRYADTYLDGVWLRNAALDVDSAAAQLRHLVSTGAWHGGHAPVAEAFERLGARVGSLEENHPRTTPEPAPGGRP